MSSIDGIPHSVKCVLLSSRSVILSQKKENIHYTSEVYQYTVAYILSILPDRMVLVKIFCIPYT